MSLAETLRIVHALKTRDFNSVRRCFPLLLRWMLPAQVLEKGWDLGTLLYGKVISGDEPRIHSAGWLFTRTKTLIRGEHSNFGLVLTFCKGLGLTGIHFKPPLQLGLVDRPEPPVYINYGVFTTSVVSVRIGFWPSCKGILQQPSGHGKHPAVLMLAGSGNGDLDSTVGALQPLRDIAEGLASNGVICLRLEKALWRCAFKQFITKSITTDDEYLPQSMKGLDLLRSHPQVDSSRIFVLGHSLGGRVAPRLCSLSGIPQGVILMGANSRAMIDSICYQNQWLQDRLPRDQAEFEADMAEIRSLRNDLEQHRQNVTNNRKGSKGLGNIPFSYFAHDFNHDAIKTLAGLTMPRLILQGENDFQVTQKEDFQAWQNTPSSRLSQDAVTCLSYQGLNHCFTTNRPEAVGTQQYDEPRYVSNEVILDLVTWIKTGRVRLRGETSPSR